MNKRRLIAAAAAAAGLSALGGVALRPGGGGEAEVKVVDVPTPPAPTARVHRLARGETLGGVFEAHGLDRGRTHMIVEAMGAFENPRRLRAGTEIRFVGYPGASPARIRIQLDRDRRLHLWPEGETGRTWAARLDSVPVTRDTIVLAGRIRTNLFEAELSGDVDRLGDGERFDVARRLSQVFAWQIDFWRDLRSDDAYRVVMARDVRPDGSTRDATVLAAEFRNDGRTLTAVAFRPHGVAGVEGVEYYDESGEALRGQFLLAPLDIVRVTSRFNLRRFHPVLRRTRPHLGVDYGAPRGTPVRATGAGRVSRAGGWGGYGTAIEIRHANNIRTRYAHLSGIARGVGRGSQVEQGQVIGYVGATGLATAPHLHYEFLRNGAQVNPARLQLPRAEPVPEALRGAFEAVRRDALSRLRLVPLPLPAEPRLRRTQD